MGQLIDLTGRSFGKLTVIRKASTRKGHAMWECLCDCGNRSIVLSGDLIKGKTKSCGCGRIAHGGHKSRLYKIWVGMKTRCYNENDHMYGLYGARGITVCGEWLYDFGAFQRWAYENGYQDSLSIDRKDTDGPYSPDNCRWSTMKEQENNRRNNRMITCNGKTQTLEQWSEDTGIHRGTIQYRLNHGWTVENALTVKVSDKNV